MTTSPPGCKGVVGKGEARLVTHAFVRPGHTRDFVRHLGCVTVELLKAVVAAHGSIERVPAHPGTDSDAASLVDSRVQICQENLPYLRTRRTCELKVGEAGVRWEDRLLIPQGSTGFHLLVVAYAFPAPLRP